MCEESIVIPSSILDVISFYIITGAILVVDFFAGCIFAPDSSIASMLLLVGLGGVSIKFIKLILGLLISILLTATPNRHSHPLLIPYSLFL